MHQNFDLIAKNNHFILVFRQMCLNYNFSELKSHFYTLIYHPKFVVKTDLQSLLPLCELYHQGDPVLQISCNNDKKM